MRERRRLVIGLGLPVLILLVMYLIASVLLPVMGASSSTQTAVLLFYPWVAGGCTGVLLGMRRFWLTGAACTAAAFAASWYASGALDELVVFPVVWTAVWSTFWGFAMPALVRVLRTGRLRANN